MQELLDKEFGVGRALVLHGMRYGEPSIGAQLEKMRRAGCRRIVVLPMYPQPAAATSGSTFDAVADVLRTWRTVPPVRFIAGYADDARFVQLIVDSVRRYWAAHVDDAKPQRLLISFHGVPLKTLLSGDAYHCWCVKTARLVGAALGLQYCNDANNHDTFAAPPVSSTSKPSTTTTTMTFGMSFQSRFGYDDWVKPYSDATLTAWAKAGVESVDVVAPAFAQDCLETLEEITGLLHETFIHAGGKRYRYM